MLEIENNLPTFKVSKLSPVKLGDIVEFAVEGNEVVVVKSKGLYPVGFATAVYADLSLQENSLTNRETLHAKVEFRRITGHTDLYETTELYPTNATLYVSEQGELTTRRPSERHPSVGLVLRSPNPMIAALHFMWL